MIVLAVLLPVLLVAGSPPRRAQTPPSPAELAAYEGLHAAAARGDATAIRHLAGAGANLDARDGTAAPLSTSPPSAGTARRRRLSSRRRRSRSSGPTSATTPLTIAAVRDDPETVRAPRRGRQRQAGDEPLRRHGADRRRPSRPRRRGARTDPRRRAARPRQQPRLDGVDRGRDPRRRRPAPRGDGAGSSRPARTRPSAIVRASRRCSTPARAATPPWLRSWSGLAPASGATPAGASARARPRRSASPGGRPRICAARVS